MYTAEKEEKAGRASPGQFEFEGVPLISFQLVKALRETGQKFRMVCVLTPDWFHGKLIEGSEWIPQDKLEQEAPKAFPNKDELIIVYCASYDCPQSTKGTKTLMQMGYKNVFDYRGGIKEWEEHGMPIKTIPWEGKARVR